MNHSLMCVTSGTVLLSVDLKYFKHQFETRYMTDENCTSFVKCLTFLRYISLANMAEKRDGGEGDGTKKEEV